MNSPINTGTAALQMASVNGVDGIGGLARTTRGGVDAPETPDWFSAQALDDGHTIEAASFDSSQTIASVDDAAQLIYSKLF